MSYASPADLAQALEIRLTAENTDLLQACLDAAATEIDHFLGTYVYVNPRISPDPGPPPYPALLTRTNVNRAVEWFKAPATYNGGVGINDTGTMNAPSSGFERHSAALLPFKVEWGVA